MSALQRDLTSPIVKQRLQSARLITFWIQVVLGVTGTLSWFWFVFGLFFGRYISSPGITIALWTSLLTLVALGGSAYLNWKLQPLTTEAASANLHPHLQRLVYLSLGGAFLAIICSAALVGDLFSNTVFRQVPITFQTSGLLLAVASTNVTLAHLTSLTGLLWVYGILDRVE
jgi:hypothetical protein